MASESFDILSFPLLHSPRSPECWGQLWQGDFIPLPRKKEGPCASDVKAYLQNPTLQISNFPPCVLWQFEVLYPDSMLLGKDVAKAQKLFFVFDHLIGHIIFKIFSALDRPPVFLTWGQWMIVFHTEKKINLLDFPKILPQTPWWFWPWNLQDTMDQYPNFDLSKNFPLSPELMEAKKFLKQKCSILWGKSFLEKMNELYITVVNNHLSPQEALGDFRLFYQKIIDDILPQIHRLQKKAHLTDIQCSKCFKGKMYVKHGPLGDFLGCSQFPDCHHTEDFFINPVTQKIEIQPKIIYHLACPECKAPMYLRTGQAKVRYAICSEGPVCSGHLPFSLQIPCPLCDGEIVERKSKKGRKFFGCSQFPKCYFTLWSHPIQTPCPNCQFPLMTPTRHKQNHQLKHSCPRCRFSVELNQEENPEEMPPEMETST